MTEKHEDFEAALKAEIEEMRTHELIGEKEIMGFKRGARWGRLQTLADVRKMWEDATIDAIKEREKFRDTNHYHAKALFFERKLSAFENNAKREAGK